VPVIAEDHPHAVPDGSGPWPWKENWAFVSADPDSATGAVFHFSLRPARGIVVLSAKIAVDGEAHRYVGRAPIDGDPASLTVIGDDHLQLTIEGEGRGFHIRFDDGELAADFRYRGRFETFDYDANPPAPGSSSIGERGLRVFPFDHQEQALHLDGTILDRRGATERKIAVGGWASRDHSWGWRDDLAFQNHHWICASFEDRFVQGTGMRERSYPDMKFGGSVTTVDGHAPVAAVELDGVYWSAEDDVPLPPLDRDVAYTVVTTDDRRVLIVAHLADPIGRVDLNYTSRDRTRAYEDRLTLCEFSLPELGLRGTGVLEVGKGLVGRDAVAAMSTDAPG
jgi:hypothetical protein